MNDEIENRLGPVLYIDNKIKETPLVIFDFHNMLDRTNDLFLRTNLMIDYNNYKENNKLLREKRINIIHSRRCLQEYISENFRLLRFYNPAYLLVQYVGGEEKLIEYNNLKYLNQKQNPIIEERTSPYKEIWLSVSIPYECRKMKPL